MCVAYVSIFIGYIPVKTKTLYVMVTGQSVFPIFMYLTVDFQIRIFIHWDIYCSQASRRYLWSVHCKNQDKSASSCATIRTGLWRSLDAPQCLTDKHWRRPDVRTTLSQSVFNKESVLRSRHCLGSFCDPSGRRGNTFGRCPVSASCPDNSETRPDNIQ